MIATAVATPAMTETALRMMKVVLTVGIGVPSNRN